MSGQGYVSKWSAVYEKPIFTCVPCALSGDLKGTENDPPLLKKILELTISLATTGIRGGLRAVCGERTQSCVRGGLSCVKGGLSCVCVGPRAVCVEDPELCEDRIQCCGGRTQLCVGRIQHCIRGGPPLCKGSTKELCGDFIGSQSNRRTYSLPFSL